MKNENTKLLINASTKKMPETNRIFVVVRDCSKLIPIIVIKEVDRNTKLPIDNNILFSPS